MSKEKVSLETCRELISGEIATRGLIVGFLVKALRDKYGNEITQLVKKANYEAGEIAGKNAARASVENDLATIADLFGRSVGTKLFNPEIVERSEGRVVIHWRSCPIPPLLSTFKEKGFPNDYLQLLCPILERFDNGFVKGFNPELTAMTPPEVGETGLNKNGSFCTIVISKKN